MNRPSVNRQHTVTLTVRQVICLATVLLLTVVGGLSYHGMQTARLADQVAAQSALLSQLQVNRSNALVRAAQPAPAEKSSPATVNALVPQDRWVF